MSEETDYQKRDWERSTYEREEDFDDVERGPDPDDYSWEDE